MTLLLTFKCRQYISKCVFQMLILHISPWIRTVNVHLFRRKQGLKWFVLDSAIHVSCQAHTMATCHTLSNVFLFLLKELASFWQFELRRPFSIYFSESLSLHEKELEYLGKWLHLDLTQDLLLCVYTIFNCPLWQLATLSSASSLYRVSLCSGKRVIST